MRPRLIKPVATSKAGRSIIFTLDNTDTATPALGNRVQPAQRTASVTPREKAAYEKFRKADEALFGGSFDERLAAVRLACQTL